MNDRSSRTPRQVGSPASRSEVRSILRKTLVGMGLYPNVTVNRLARRLWPSGYQRLAGMPPAWSIGVLEGPSPVDLRADPAVRNPVISKDEITDVRALLVADPFAVCLDSRWHIFFEVLNAETAKGEIALATSTDLHSWTYEGVVLVEPFHLSYPFVFEWNDVLYMVPETWEAGSVRLYRASDSPTRWAFVCDLLRGPVFLDSTVLFHRDHWWMFTETNPKHRYDTLRLFGAAKLTGPWSEHPQSPLVQGDSRIARPAGRVVASDRVIRFTQDCSGLYGQGVRAFEITELSTERYAETPLGLQVDLGAWGATAMHHIDPHRTSDGRWSAFVDGR
jgi:hypothetical protein